MKLPIDLFQKCGVHKRLDQHRRVIALVGDLSEDVSVNLNHSMETDCNQELKQNFMSEFLYHVQYTKPVS